MHMRAYAWLRAQRHVGADAAPPSALSGHSAAASLDAVQSSESLTVGYFAVHPTELAQPSRRAGIGPALFSLAGTPPRSQTGARGEAIRLRLVWSQKRLQCVAS